MAASSDSDPVRPRRAGRFNHRSQSHNEAHSATGVADDYLHHAHPLATSDPPKLVTRQADLMDLVGRLRSAGSFAYDSEFIGELTYVPKLCLIQAATAQEVAIIDPLAQLDLTPFWELITDAAVEKIVHAGQQDVEPVFRLLHKRPANLFDTQIAAGFISLCYPLSLSKLVYATIGAKLTKGLTFTHWDQRPLSAMQLRYAADDVRYLPAVRDEMRRRLNAAGHSDWAAEECASLTDPSVYTFDPQSHFMRIRGAGNLQPKNLAVLRELTIWRDATARRQDVPPRSLVKDEILLDMARNPIRAVEGLARVRGLPRPVEMEHGAELIEATTRALAIKPGDLPSIRTDEPTPQEKFTADGLWTVVQSLCIGNQIDPMLVTSRQEVGEFVRLATAGEDLSSHQLMQGWRRRAVGDTLIAFMNGKVRVDTQWQDRIKTIAIDVC